MIVNKQLAKKVLKSTELGRSCSPPKLARFFEPQCRSEMIPKIILKIVTLMHTGRLTVADQ